MTSSRNQHDFDAGGMSSPQGSQIAVRNLKLWVQQRAVDVRGQQPYGSPGSSHLQNSISKHVNHSSQTRKGEPIGSAREASGLAGTAQTSRRSSGSGAKSISALKTHPCQHGIRPAKPGPLPPPQIAGHGWLLCQDLFGPLPRFFTSSLRFQEH